MDWIAAIFEATAAWQIGSKRRIGFVFFAIGNVLWTIVAVQNELWGLLALMAVFFGLNIRGFVKWRK